MKYINYVLAACTFLIVVFLLSIVFGEKTDDNQVYAKYQQFKKQHWTGLVVDKYLDSLNHNSETILLDSGRKMTIFCIPDHFYDFLKTGDIITKVYETDSIRVVRNGEFYNFRIDFGYTK
jgi:hypothetical protein